MITNSRSNTRVDEVASGIYRLSTPSTKLPGGFSFNQYLVVDDTPLLFHTGPRGMFPLVREAIAAVMPVERLRYIAFSHFENDECGALNLLLAAAPTRAAVWSHQRDDQRRRLRPRAPRPGRRRGARARHPHGPLDRHAASAARLGMRLPVRDRDADPLLRRSLHPAGHGRHARDRSRHPGAQRDDAGGARLLRAHTRYARAAGAGCRMMRSAVARLVASGTLWTLHTRRRARMS